MEKLFFLIFLPFFIPLNVEGRVANNEIRKELVPTIQAIKEEVKITISPIRQQLRKETKERLSQPTVPVEGGETVKRIREENKELINQIKNQVKEKLQNLKFSAKIKGKVIEIGENYLKVQDGNNSLYTVNLTDKTQLQRRFWGKSKIEEFKVGDQVSVIGKYANQEKTTIEAVLIRNLSIQKRWGVFFGQVLSSSQDQLTIKTINQGELTVYYQKTTKLINREGKAINWQDIIAGHRVRVKGVWDKDLKEIKEVEEIKDFSLPIKITVTSGL